ncbi:MAG: ATP synthase F1 subunit delta [Planctomycetia bacterium]|nr:ATP synthase F1 subunit delta [Planctomycetia bacterium]
MSEAIQVQHQTVMDDDTRQVARVYADALYKAADAGALVQQVREELGVVVEGLFVRDPGLGLFFESASITRERKAEAIERAFSGASQTMRSFLGVLNAHDRLMTLRPIAEAFGKLCDRVSRRVAVQVTSAVQLTDDERRRVSDDVRAVANVEPILEEKIDPDILGGLIVRIADWVYDASVRTRLATIRKQLIERSGHGVESGRDRFGS